MRDTYLGLDPFSWAPEPTFCMEYDIYMRVQRDLRGNTKMPNFNTKFQLNVSSALTHFSQLVDWVPSIYHMAYVVTPTETRRIVTVKTNKIG